MCKYFRKDVIVLAICLYISLIGSLVLIISKYFSRKTIQRIPQSNILQQPSINQEESFQMTTFHSTARIFQEYFSKKTIQSIPQSDILQQPSINQEESFQMTTFHSTARIIQVQPISTNDTGGDLFLLCTKSQFPLCLSCEKIDTRCKKTI